MSYKRFLGWEPTPGDSVEWDSTEREWMLALQIYENAHVCPVCGMDIDFCHDEHQVRSVFKRSDVTTCFVGEMREKSMRAFAESGDVIAPNSQTTKLVTTTE